ncbi:MAG: tRNA (N6-isopentenyl adenosine(37)-C2)-methylthiotransferase MiaB [Myxococcota bacterium]|nr:tRNA (N6-isopentenyl adenosine(37)-C2)-methylthiotransferase MiaB [Myxococcota bacterium]
MEGTRSFAIRTYGCQMNVHDSQKLANLLHHAGYAAATSEGEADLLIINTCSIREKAEHHLYSDLGGLKGWRAASPGRVLGVGGCVAQQVGDALLGRFPQLDFVFGTHNIRHVALMAAAAERGERSADTSETTSLDRFDLPARQPQTAESTPGRAFLTVMEGCDMFCSFCIVPRTRGREVSRPAADILGEARALVDRGVREVTLLGQTVNAYGRHDRRRGHSAAAGTLAFAALLAELDAISGLERIRYTSPHPSFFDDALVRAHGELESLCPHVHLPLQSGSNAVLAAMRRRYTREAFLELVEALRSARPDIALTSDLIVGFPGETDDDFQDTLELVERVRFVDHYSFKYSSRPGTAAAELAVTDAVPAEVAQDRLERLQGLQRRLTLAYHRRRVGECSAVLIEGPSRRGGSQLCGRDPYNRVVNLDGAGSPVAPGAIGPVEIVDATPHSLIGEWSSSALAS